MTKYRQILKYIKQRAEKYRQMPDEKLRRMTGKLQAALAEGRKTEMEILPDAFAVVAEAAYRVLGMYPYDVQFMGGIALAKGHIAQMKTGEGKTLVAALPSYLHALSGEGVHVVTCNDYLAARDADEIGRIHEFLGLTVGCVTHDMDGAARKEAYACDITYVTNSELGFDYLRDNMAINKSEIVLRGLHCCIIDEADSILIDDARTPLIISGAGSQKTEIYMAADTFVRSLVKGKVIGNDTKLTKLSGNTAKTTGDYIVDEERKQTRLTTDGMNKAERYFRVKNIADPACRDLRHAIDMALKAHANMKRDVDYIVDDGKVKVVDKNTGRVLGGRRYSDGLHQALEAKEGVDILRESQTRATITYQTFFNKYELKSGMTGTVGSERTELKETYGMETDIIPTNRKVARKDQKDILFLSKGEKYRAILQEVKKAYAGGQPVLIGTGSVEVSEDLSRCLSQERIPHRVLNAKQHAYEAQIVAQAGRKGAVTIATNMAGRGTDIKLDPEAKVAGGLKVIGSERFESGRIDDQLIGRAGRQGDPGESLFLLSMEDDLLRIYSSDKDRESMERKLQKKHMAKGHPVKAYVRKAQRNVEGANYIARKNVMDYDKVLNDQRDLLYGERDRIMEQENLDTFMLGLFRKTAKDSADSLRKKINTYRTLHEEFSKLVPVPYGPEELKGLSPNKVERHLYEDMVRLYNEVKEKVYDDPVRRTNVIRNIALKKLDGYWIRHLGTLDQLKQGVALQGYGQTDPKNVYAINAYEEFDVMLVNARLEIVQTFFSVASKAASFQSKKRRVNERRKIV